MVRIVRSTGHAAPERLDLSLRDLPLVIGRGGQAGLRLEEEGVWDQHAELSLQARDSFMMRACGEALLIVNGRAVAESRLRSGDLVEVGGARLRFGFTETQQRRFRLRERASWVAIGLLCLVQLLLIYRLLP